VVEVDIVLFFLLNTGAGKAEVKNERAEKII
jgi:hypothetical protein